MTSNLGANVLASLPEGTNSQDGKAGVMQVVRQHLAPEFINRIDDLVLFNRLSHENMDKIVEIQLGAVSARLAEKKIELSITPESKEYLGRRGYDPVYGARPLQRVIQKEILNPIAKLLIKGDIKEGDLCTITTNGEGLKFDIKKNPNFPATAGDGAK
eukprot:CAMPEP_0168513702 /NCGR_PEP_ID=MMETSP0405-20121227/3643_1 /TAXON_ID=498012 /ORGANISM="Trichosphaerium sp, Strain Am-I-7 wt" /LENGTH=157 /DNA_ID=CAMNT_0008532631 /DNA_START=186 /DNA_END=659 /DNA_ORIENTATION=+